MRAASGLKKTKRRSPLLLLVPSLLLGAHISAAPLELTLEKALELALVNNPAQRLARAGVEQARKKLMQNLGFLPQVSLDGARILDEKLMSIEMPPMFPGQEPQRFSLRFTQNYEFTLQFVQPVFSGGKIIHNYRNARIDLALAGEKERNSAAETALQVKKAFYNILVLEKLIITRQEALDLALKNLAAVKRSYELGMVSRYDLLRAELAVSSLRPELTQVKSMLELSLLNLKSMTGLDLDEEITVSGELEFQEIEPEADTLLAEALAKRSELRQLDMEKNKIDNLVKIAYGQLSPDLAIVGRYSFRSDHFKFRSDNWEDYYTISLGLSWPIFTGLKRSGTIGELQVMRKMIAISRLQLEAATRLEIESLLAGLAREKEKVLMGRDHLASAEEGARIAELNYGEGLISILELNASLNDLTMARVNHLQALYNYNVALAELRKITGSDPAGGLQ